MARQLQRYPPLQLLDAAELDRQRPTTGCGSNITDAYCRMCQRDLLSCHFQPTAAAAAGALNCRCGWQTRLARRACGGGAGEIAFIERAPCRSICCFRCSIHCRPPALPPAEQATFHGLSRRYGIQVETVADVNSPAMLQRLRQLQPDLLISARFSHIFKAAALAIPCHGIVNVHPGELPLRRAVRANAHYAAGGRN